MRQISRKKEKSSGIEGRIANIEKMMTKLSDMANTKKREEEKEPQAEAEQVRGAVGKKVARKFSKTRDMRSVEKKLKARTRTKFTRLEFSGVEDVPCNRFYVVQLSEE